jgi:hypothetical protein
MIDIKDITPGASYACRFRVVTMLDETGNPAQLQIGEAAQGPGEYEGLGVIRTRDLESEMVIVVDTQTQHEYTVSFEHIWDIDTVEWNDG